MHFRECRGKKDSLGLTENRTLENCGFDCSLPFFFESLCLSRHLTGIVLGYYHLFFFN